MSNVVCGVGEGVGACVNGKNPHKLMQMCPKTFVHDCSYCLGLIFCLQMSLHIFIFAGNAQSVSESWSL